MIVTKTRLGSVTVLNANELNELYQKTLLGDETAKELLFDILRVRFRYLANQRIRDTVDAEDVVQDALTKTAEKFLQTNIRVSFAAWAVRILDNCVLSYFKDMKSRERRLASWSAPMQADDPDFGLKDQLLKCLRQVVKTNRRYARILNLHYQGHTTKEICKRLNMSANHVHVALCRARSMLAACLQRRKDDLTNE